MPKSQIATFPLKKLQSTQDLSANLVLPSGQECRYVRREDSYFIVYLSSHNGCNKACRFCHLTQTGQTSFDEASVDEMLSQADLVLTHYIEEVAAGRQAPAPRVHFNWMARGEPLASSVIRTQWQALTQGLAELARAVGVHDFRFNISTIFPEEVDYETLARMGGEHRPVVFYSLYSMNTQFRKRWLPKAQSPANALAALASWQRDFFGEVVLHWAYIEGENDSVADSEAILAAVAADGLAARFNLVRYNPFTQAQGEEPAEEVLANRFAEMLQGMKAAGSRMVPRVGLDVKASCGMFVA